jgi:hypothetical protein
MWTKPRCRLGIAVALGFCWLPLAILSEAAPPKDSPPEYYKGKVVRVADVLEKLGSKLDADAAATMLALSAADGKLYPLIKDDGSRMFYKDDSLLNRPMRLTGRLIPGSQLLQVVEVHSYRKEVLHSVYYWCDICNIKRFEKKNCECCGGPMELRETAVK